MRNYYSIVDGVALINIVRRNGDKFTVLVDESDVNKLNGWSVSLMPAHPNHPEQLRAQICRGNGKPKEGNWYYLHRYITGATSGFDVDHVNYNQLDNRQCNLRVITHKENLQNRRGAACNNLSSGVRGVTWYNRDENWQAQVVVNSQRNYLGRYDTVAEAQAVVEEFRRKHMPYSEMDKAA